MEKLNRNLLSLVKRGFVEMPAGQGPGPVAGGGMMSQAQAMPMDPNAGGGAPMGDPNAGAGGMPPGGDPMMGMPGGMPPGGDPSMGAGGPPPADPNAAAGAPPPPDPNAGMPPPPPTGQIILSPADLIQIIESVKGSGGAAASPSKPKSSGGGSDQKLDQILSLLQGAMGGAGAPPPAQ